MNLYQLNYIVGGTEALSFVIAKNKKQAENALHRGNDFKLISIKECDLTTTNIIHTEIYETI